MSAAFKEEAARLHAGLRRKFLSSETRSVSWRRAQLKQLLRLLEENSEALASAICSDLSRPRSEASSEVAVTAREAAESLSSFEEWMKPQWKAAHLFVAPAAQEMRYEPFGSCLIVAPYNYPVNLLFAPLAGALAAGCNVMLKPSEISVSTEKLVKDLVSKYFAEDVCCVVTGAAEESAAILELRWDMVFFTGSTRVGRLVAQTCSKHLTPHVLELGGKAPCIVDETATSLREAARRIVSTKFINAGQTCMAPDYVIAHENVVDELCDELLACVRHFYGSDPRASQDLARLVSPRHASHVIKLLNESDGDVLCGGSAEAEESDCYVPPTIVKNPTLGRSALLRDEIFGPVLPVISFSSVANAVDQINSIDQEPLAMYIFSGRKNVQEQYIAHVRSGDVCINDCYVHALLAGIPFGGQGTSGYGAYHGKYTFEAFSTKRGVLHRHGYLDVAYLVPNPGGVNLRYPPDSKWRQTLLPLLLRYGPTLHRVFSWENLGYAVFIAAVIGAILH